MKRKSKLFYRFLSALLIPAFFCGVCMLGWLNMLDGIVSDGLYQSVRSTDGTVVVIGMDQRALDALGPLPWPRSYMAEAIRRLNSKGPEERPAVIGIDVLYVGESGDASADAALTEAAAEGGNVVVAAAATFGSDLVEDEASFYMADRSVLAWDEPFAALAKAASFGQINAMADTDGILRHALLYVEVPGIGRVDSFSRVIYERYCRQKGTAPNASPETTDGFFYIPFTAKSGGYYEYVSVADLLDGGIDPSFFKDKIVLIGPYAAGMQDEYRTSVDHATPMYGVEIQANIIDAFRRGFYPAEVPDSAQLALLFAICALMLFFFYDRSVKSAVAGWLSVCLLWIGICKLAWQFALILHVLWIPLFVTVLFVGSVAFNYIRSQRERRLLTNTFGHYIDPSVMNELLAQGSDALKLGGKMYRIAVLFVDVRGFTSMSEALDPPTVVEIINRYLTLTTDCIMKNHGTLDKFVGDCTMAFWNAPIEQKDPVYLACCAAMDMVEGAKVLGEELTQRFGRSVSFGVGVNWGPAVVGNIGAPLRMDYTAIGDTVNTAARLEANAPGGKILISRAVADMLGSRAKVTSLGDTIKLKGKAEGFEILTLDALER